MTEDKIHNRIYLQLQTLYAWYGTYVALGGDDMAVGVLTVERPADNHIRCQTWTKLDHNMSALSGITISDDLASRFTDAVQENNIRFIKVSIQNGLFFEAIQQHLLDLWPSRISRY